MSDLTLASAAGRWWTPFREFDNVLVAHVDLTPHPTREAEALSWLDEKERLRYNRFLNPGPRRRFALCRAALRAFLCDRLRCNNNDLEFGASYYEKPFAIVRSLASSVSFNVSHNGRHGLIAFSHKGRLGVDVEEYAPRRNLDLLIEGTFTSDEQKELALTQETDRLNSFLQLWTIKEAVIKAVGLGLALDMSTFEVPVAMCRGAISSSLLLPQTPHVNWRLESFGNKNFAAALAYEEVPTQFQVGLESKRHIVERPLR